MQKCVLHEPMNGSFAETPADAKLGCCNFVTATLLARDRPTAATRLVAQAHVVAYRMRGLSRTRALCCMARAGSQATRPHPKSVSFWNALIR